MEDKKVKVSCTNCGQTNYYPEGAQEKKLSVDAATALYRRQEKSSR